ncbi:MAG: M15 family metallopeptidase [Actinomycetota bacterium]
MLPVGLDAIRSRINQLDQLLSPASPTARQLGSAAEFDAFGTSYQAAIEQRDRAAPLPPSATVPSSFRAWATSSSSAAAIPGVDTRTLTAAVQGNVAPPGERSIGGYGPMPVPDALRAFGNGHVPASALTEIAQSGHRLYAPAAASWDNLVAAARADGIEMRITDSYRSYDQQVDLVRRKGLYSEGGLGARPGTSNHGWGLAVDADVTDARTREWLKVNGPRFGWIETVPREPWHWEFRPHQA